MIAEYLHRKAPGLYSLVSSLAWVFYGKDVRELDEDELASILEHVAPGSYRLLARLLHSGRCRVDVSDRHVKEHVLAGAV